jgi:hypothetical protein
LNNGWTLFVQANFTPPACCFHLNSGVLENKFFFLGSCWCCPKKAKKALIFFLSSKPDITKFIRLFFLRNMNN